jgi:hypothetical protein
MDYWVSSPELTDMLEAVLPDQEAFDFLDLSKKFIRRVLLHNELIFVYRDSKGIHRLELKPIIQELERILITAKEFLSTIEGKEIYFIRPQY